ncbi:hypothetical protein DTO012A7_4568 [Penicillium roqueforti]|nr:hypothetical protein CBS147318_112 [Penicillium roqueforti]KAI2731222.1 hypothetical protein CBS147354_331 [Penicillium roqueforti]KAI3114071.1 hypothetical protein CBS147333_2306 [Penicillium roqueforti]KAI3141553.1 hypothetical protein CBS147326_1640 [Penicillium roqueforti]KAI3142768.1 hypothetical protein CBS147330_555 [Penicillium roqueforti]
MPLRILGKTFGEVSTVGNGQTVASFGSTLMIKASANHTLSLRGAVPWSRDLGASHNINGFYGLTHQ